MKSNDILSRAASEIHRLAINHNEACGYDALFDGGEWSIPAHGDMEAEEQREIAHRYGYKNVTALFDAIEARTSARWMHFCFPHPVGAEDEYEHDSIHGRNANR